jgi:hypothetical protein
LTSLPLPFPLLVFMVEGAPWTASSLSVFCFLGADERWDGLGAAGSSSNNRLLKVLEVLISSGFVADACGMVIYICRLSLRDFGTIKGRCNKSDDVKANPRLLSFLNENFCELCP